MKLCTRPATRVLGTQDRPTVLAPSHARLSPPTVYIADTLRALSSPISVAHNTCRGGGQRSFIFLERNGSPPTCGCHQDVKDLMGFRPAQHVPTTGLPRAFTSRLIERAYLVLATMRIRSCDLARRLDYLGLFQCTRILRRTSWAQDNEDGPHTADAGSPSVRPTILQGPPYGAYAMTGKPFSATSVGPSTLTVYSYPRLISLCVYTVV